MEQVFDIEMQVRDYECDMQGIVNNAVYQNYLEHCRHEFLHTIGLDFGKLCEDGIDAVVTRIEMDYRQPLRSRDRFTVRLGMRRQGRLRFVFDQSILRKTDGRTVLEACVTGVLTRNGKPIAPTLFDEVFRSNGWSF
jgi:acyl-CoA thioester hydrolase